MFELIKDNNEAAYRDEVRNLPIWFDNNKLSRNVEKTITLDVRELLKLQCILITALLRLGAALRF